MAKRGSPKEMETVAEIKPQPVRVDLEPEVHYLLRQVAARERMSMAKYARVMLTRVIREEIAKRR